MKIIVRATSPGHYSVYGSDGLCGNRLIGHIRRVQSLIATKTQFFDLKENRHELGSLPKAWPNQIKRILESNHD